MTELVNVEGTELAVREYNGQRVVTFRDIDNAHQRPAGTAYRNFRQNKKYFSEGKDYIVVKPDFKTYEIRLSGITPNKKGTTLITERGYLKVVKSFNDELSWKVQDALVDAYFAVKNQQPTTAIEEKPVLPIETDWFCINRWKINFICGVYKLSTREYMHSLLLQIGKTYNFDNAKQEFMRCTGRLPKSNSEVITYFQELADTATKILNDDIEHYKEMWKKENDPD
jgi:hypothetical protein